MIFLILEAQKKWWERKNSLIKVEIQCDGAEEKKEVFDWDFISCVFYLDE